jgi:sugar-phosphatase
VSDAGFVASVFDMDGLLIDSEPLWQIAEVEILGTLGVPIDPHACRQTKGMFVNEVTAYWHERFPWPGPSSDEVAVEVVDRVCDLVVERGVLQPGVSEAIGLCRRHGLDLAIASSSQYRLIELVLGHFGLAQHFPVIHSAEEEPFGKPHPGVYLGAAAKLGVDPTRCLAWEDAAAGVLAAKAARMVCVAVPEPLERSRPEFGIADAVLASLAEVDDGLYERLVAARDAPAIGDGGEAQRPRHEPRIDQFNLVVGDMEASVAFYRRLGLEIPDVEEGWAPHHRSASSSGLDLDFDSEAFAAKWNQGWQGGRGVLGFKVVSRDEVDERYKELTGDGYRSEQPPYDAFWGARYAIVEDPDGNAVGIMSPVDPAMRSTAPTP